MCTVPSSVGIIGTYFPNGVKKNRAFFIYGASGAVGFVIGLVIVSRLVTDFKQRYASTLFTYIFTDFFGKHRVAS